MLSIKFVESNPLMNSLNLSRHFNRWYVISVIKKLTKSNIGKNQIQLKSFRINMKLQLKTQV